MSLPVTITTTGSSFSPKVALVAGSSATVTWACPSASITTTGLNPTLSFGSAATRTVYMTVADSNGYEAIDQIAVFNLGYNHANDAGTYSPSSSYDYTAQSVSGVGGIHYMTGLQLFLAANISALTGTLDFTGCSQLTNIELFDSSVQAVVLVGCASLQRLCAEGNNLTSLDLNPVADCVREVRAAVQQGGILTLAPLSKPLALAYHFCVRDQIVQNMPDPATALPVAYEIWTWNTGQAGVLAPQSQSAALTGLQVLVSLQAYENWYVTADVANRFPVLTSTPYGVLDLHSNQLTSVDLTGCGGLGNINLSYNQFSQATVNGILAAVDGWGTSGGTLNLAGCAAPTSGTSNTHVTSLQGRSWTVTVESSGGGGVGTKFTFGENVLIRTPSGVSHSIRGTLASAVNSGDLLIAAIEDQATPTVYDSSGNTWTVIGPYGGYVYLAYCLSAAASADGLTVTAYGSGLPNGLALARYVPTGAVSYGGAAGANGASAGGLNAGSTNSLGSLGTVPAHALVWGVLFDDDNTDPQGYYGTGYQYLASGTTNEYGFKIPGPDPNGGGIILYVLDAANTTAALTWYGSGTGAGGYAGTMYFTV